MTVVARSRHSIRMRGRSVLALVLAPEPPATEWLAELDALLKRSSSFFAGRPMILDVSALPLSKPELSALITHLRARDIRLIGIEGADPSWLDTDTGTLVPIHGGRPVGLIELPNDPSPKALSTVSAPQQASSLLLNSPVRSGQSVLFLEGDATVVGSVASGAEVIAGGSIHIYGTLRGRVIAGATGNARACIFCHRLEAELAAIDGVYKTAEDMTPDLRGQPVHAWLEGDAIRMALLN